MPLSINPEAKYGRLVPVEPAGKTAQGQPLWLFRCDCGTAKVARVYRVLDGKTRSCGCLHTERTHETSRMKTAIKPGSRFCRLTAVAEQPRDGNPITWLFHCDCGADFVARAAKVKSGHTRSCGCLSRETSRKRLLRHGYGNYKTREYRVWCCLKARCHNPRNCSYPDYGARGITVCDRWLGRDGFLNFLADMGACPSTSHSIDRLDNSRGYSPDNCAWRTHTEQMNNRRGNVTLTYNGETLTLSQWSRRLNIKRATLNARVRMGWDATRTITTPVS